MWFVDYIIIRKVLEHFVYCMELFKGANSVLTDRVEVLALLNININLNNVKENAYAKELNWYNISYSMFY